MNLFFRILLAVYAFFLTIISAIAVSITVKKEIFTSVYVYLMKNVLSNRNTSLAMLLIALVFFGLSLTFLLSGFKSDKDKKAVSKYTNIGEIKISLNSLENIALAASKKLSGVRETKAYVTKRPDGVSITIKAVILSETNVPVLSEDMQVRVKSLVEETTGIQVNDVRVIVENIYTGGYKSRVE